MQTLRAQVLIGHLNDYALPDLIGILHHQRETGRLLVEFPNHPGVFDFENGHMIDAQFDVFHGLQAVRVALAQPKASFNFDPQVRPTRRTIDAWSQKVILELFGCWGSEAYLEMPATIAGSRQAIVASSSPPLPLSTAATSALEEARPAAPAEEAAGADNYQAPAAIKEMPAVLLPAPFSSLTPPPHRRRQATLFAGGAACLLLLLGLSATISLTNRARQTDAPPSSAAQPSAVSPGAEAATAATATTAVNAPFGQVADALPAANENSSQASSPIEAKTSSPFSKLRKLNHEPGGATAPDDLRADNEETTTAPPAASPVAVAAAIPAAAKPAGKAEKTAKKQTPDGADGEAVKVVMQVENGRVVRASVVNSRPGMRAYEALALRIARSRRYAAKTGEETMTIKVNPPQPQ